jgi:hypothetical protein
MKSIQKTLGSYCQNITDNYFKIFFENSSRKRLVFFSDPLVQYLWAMFRQRCVSSFNEYIAEMITQEQGKEKVIKLVKDACQLQEAIEFQVLP